jgi:hypothetical protein
MFTKILIMLLCCSISVIAQQNQNADADNGIYLSAADFTQHKIHLPFHKSEGTLKSPLGHYHELWLKTKDSIYKFYDDDIWGYRENKEDYRIFKSDPYKIGYAGKIIIYTIPSTPGNGTGSTIFFSKDIDSPVHSLTKQKLMDAYHENIGFVEKLKKMKWNKSIFKWNKTTGHYEFIDWLK